MIDICKKVHEQITPETWSRGPGNGACKCIGLWVMDVHGMQGLYKCLTALGFDPKVQAVNVLFNWNDHEDRTYEEVYKLVKSLDL